jgi:hypothetical protein
MLIKSQKIYNLSTILRKLTTNEINFIYIVQKLFLLEFI